MLQNLPLHYKNDLVSHSVLPQKVIYKTCFPMANRTTYHLVTKLVILVQMIQSLVSNLDLDKPLNLLPSILSTEKCEKNLAFMNTGTQFKNSSKQASDVLTGAGVSAVSATDFLRDLLQVTAHPPVCSACNMGEMQMYLLEWLNH